MCWMLIKDGCDQERRAKKIRCDPTPKQVTRFEPKRRIDSSLAGNRPGFRSLLTRIDVEVSDDEGEDLPCDKTMERKKGETGFRMEEIGEV